MGLPLSRFSRIAAFSDFRLMQRSPVQWKLARRTLSCGARTLIMGILNVTPDSFSDGGEFLGVDRAVRRAESMVEEGADIIDIGGESTRPGARTVTAAEELRRVLPVIERLAGKISVPLSIDTTKGEVARAALDAGADVVNDISGLRFDRTLAEAAANAKAGLVLMHSRGDLATMHGLEPVHDIFADIRSSLNAAIEQAEACGVGRESIAVDPGIGFSKSFEQNLEILARLDVIVQSFASHPILVGTSRKSFIGRILGGAPVNARIHGTMATVTAAILGGAHIIRVHDVAAARETARVADAIRRVA